MLLFDYNNVNIETNVYQFSYSIGFVTMNDTLGLSSYTDAQSMNFSVNRLEGTTGESVDHARFLLPPKKTFKTQYNAIYVQRLNAMRPKLVENINRAFANEGQSTQIPVCTRLVDAMPDEEVVIIGTT